MGAHYNRLLMKHHDWPASYPNLFPFAERRPFRLRPKRTARLLARRSIQCIDAARCARPLKGTGSIECLTTNSSSGVGLPMAEISSTETLLFEQLREKGVAMDSPSWESCRRWLNEHDWKINVLSDYPKGEIRFTIRHGFERIELSGRSDLEVMAKAILEVVRRNEVNREK
jgi:hypothetical protein